MTEPYPVSSIREKLVNPEQTAVLQRQPGHHLRCPGHDVALLEEGACRTELSQAVANTKLKEGGMAWPLEMASSDFL